MVKSSRRLILIFLIAFTLSSCATIDVGKEIESINNRPYIADSVVVEEHSPIVLKKLERFELTPEELNNLSKKSKRSLIKVDAQRRADRKTLKQLDAALAAKIEAEKYLVKTVKASEQESRAYERMLVRTKGALEEERKNAKISDVVNRLTILGLLGVLVSMGF